MSIMRTDTDSRITLSSLVCLVAPQRALLLYWESPRRTISSQQDEKNKKLEISQTSVFDCLTEVKCVSFSRPAHSYHSHKAFCKCFLLCIPLRS
jgi:hypothetical protein